MAKEVRVVGDEREKKFWLLGEMEFENIERSVFKSILSNVAGKKFTVDELKELGDVSAKRNGGLMVKVGVSKEREASMLFGTKYGKYVYRGVSFSTIKEVLV